MTILKGGGGGRSDYVKSVVLLGAFICVAVAIGTTAFCLAGIMPLKAVPVLTSIALAGVIMEVAAWPT